MKVDTRREALTFAALLLSQGLVALAGLISTRYLNPADKGLFTAAYLWALACQTVIGLSLPNALLYFGTAQQRTRPSRQLLITLEFFALAAGALLADAIAGRNAAGIAFAVILTLLPAVEVAFEVVSYAALAERGSFSTYRITQGVVFAALGVPLVYATHSATLLLGSLFVSYALTLAIHIPLRRPSVRNRSFRLHLEMPQLLRWSTRAHPGLVLSLLAGRLDILLVTMFLSPYLAGQYAGALAIPSVLTYFGTALGLALAQRATAHAQQGEIPRFVWYVQAGLFIFSCLAGALLIWQGGAIVRAAFGAAYSPAAALLLPLALALPLWNITSYQSQLLSAVGRPTDQTLGQGMAAVVLFAGSACSVLLSDLQIAAWANVAAYAVAAGWQGIRLRAPTPHR